MGSSLRIREDTHPACPDNAGGWKGNSKVPFPREAAHRSRMMPPTDSEMISPRGDGRYARIQRALGGVELLILDDWGLEHLDALLVTICSRFATAAEWSGRSPGRSSAKCQHASRKNSIHRKREGATDEVEFTDYQCL